MILVMEEIIMDASIELRDNFDCLHRWAEKTKYNLIKTKSNTYERSFFVCFENQKILVEDELDDTLYV